MDKKAGYNTRTATMEGKEWYIRQGIWAVIEDHEKYASESKRISHHYIWSKAGCLSFRIKNPKDTRMS